VYSSREVGPPFVWRTHERARVASAEPSAWRRTARSPCGVPGKTIPYFDKLAASRGLIQVFRSMRGMPAHASGKAGTAYAAAVAALPLRDAQSGGEPGGETPG
jgi:hypothetical protein